MLFRAEDVLLTAGLHFDGHSGALDELGWVEKGACFLCLIYGSESFIRFMFAINTRSRAKEGTEGANGMRLSKSKGEECDGPWAGIM